MLCHSSSDDSSLRAGLCHLGSTGTHDIQGIAPSLNYIQSFHFCHHGGSYMEVFSCVRHEMPYRHVYYRVTTYKYGSSDRCCFCCPSPLGNGSLCFVPFSLSCYGYMCGIFTYEQFPCKSHPVLPCLDLFAVDGLYCAMSYCTGVFNRFLYFTIMVIHYLATCIRGYLGVQESAYQGPSSSLPSVRFSPHRAILNLLNGHTFIHIAVVYGRIPATTQWWESCYLNQQVTLYS